MKRKIINIALSVCLLVSCALLSACSNSNLKEFISETEKAIQTAYDIVLNDDETLLSVGDFCFKYEKTTEDYNDEGVCTVKTYSKEATRTGQGDSTILKTVSSSTTKVGNENMTGITEEIFYGKFVDGAEVTYYKLTKTTVLGNSVPSYNYYTYSDAEDYTANIYNLSSNILYSYISDNTVDFEVILYESIYNTSVRKQKTDFVLTLALDITHFDSGIKKINYSERNQIFKISKGQFSEMSSKEIQKNNNILVYKNEFKYTYAFSATALTLPDVTIYGVVVD